jgi:DNA-binding CsgD family transcriptional regulator
MVATVMPLCQNGKMAATGNAKPTARRMQIAEARKRDALELRLRGHNYVEIGEALGVSSEGARYAVKKAMAEIRTEAAETAIEVREQEAARLDRMLLRLEGLLEQSADDVTAALAIQDRMLRVQDRRAKLLGLDLQRVELTGAGGGPIEIAAIQRVIVDPTTIDVGPVLDAEIVNTGPMALEAHDAEGALVDVQAPEKTGVEK